MKKRYDAPTAEKLEFDYTDTVVASGTSPNPPHLMYVDAYIGCREIPTNQWNITSLSDCM